MYTRALEGMYSIHCILQAMGSPTPFDLSFSGGGWHLWWKATFPTDTKFPAEDNIFGGIRHFWRKTTLLAQDNIFGRRRHFRRKTTFLACVNHNVNHPC
jgi:hypothetical protein